MAATACRPTAGASSAATKAHTQVRRPVSFLFQIAEEQCREQSEDSQIDQDAPDHAVHRQEAVINHGMVAGKMWPDPKDQDQ